MKGSPVQVRASALKSPANSHIWRQRSGLDENMSRICPETGLDWGMAHHGKPLRGPLRDTFSGSIASAARSGTPSTGCPTAARSSGRSARPGRARPTGGRLLHQAHRGSLAARRARRSAARHASRPGQDRRDVRRGGRRVAALRRARPRPQALDDRRLPGDPRAQLLPAFGEKPIESITTPMVESWIAGVDRAPATRTKALVLMHGIFKRAKKVYGLPLNPVAEVEKPPTRRAATSRSSRSRRSWRWSARLPPSRTPRST